MNSNTIIIKNTFTLSPAQQLIIDALFIKIKKLKIYENYNYKYSLKYILTHI